MMVRGHHGPARSQRFGHPDGPARHPVADESLEGARRDPVGRRSAERHHDVATPGATMGGQAEHAGEPVLVEPCSSPAPRS